MKKTTLFLAFGLKLLASFEEKDPSFYEFSGKHYVASFIDCDHDALINLKTLKDEFIYAVKESGATILESCEYTFSEDGFTMVLLLSESHASIHTYPEHNACFIDLFTCGTKCEALHFDKALQKYLKPKFIDHKLIERNKETKLI